MTTNPGRAGILTASGEVRVRFVRAGATLAAVGLVVGACGSSHPSASKASSSATTVAVSSSPTTAAATTTTTQPASKGDAAAVAVKLKAAGLPITGLIVYNAATDPNSLLGRPGQYTSKAAWVDTRVPASAVVGDDPGDVDAGGGIEVFSEASEAKSRAAYIQSLTQASPIFGVEYDYLAGDAVIRVSGKLTPAQAAAYGTTVGGKLYTGK